MRLKFLIAATMLATPCAAFATDWRFIAQAEDKSYVMIDFDEMTRDGDHVTTWVDYVVKYVAGITVSNTRAKEKFDCANGTVNRLFWIRYDRAGKTIGTENHTTDYDFDYKPAVPETLGYLAMKAACERAGSGS